MEIIINVTCFYAQIHIFENRYDVSLSYMCNIQMTKFGSLSLMGGSLLENRRRIDKSRAIPGRCSYICVYCYLCSLQILNFKYTSTHTNPSTTYQTLRVCVCSWHTLIKFIAKCLFSSWKVWRQTHVRNLKDVSLISIRLLSFRKRTHLMAH